MVIKELIPKQITQWYKRLYCKPCWYIMLSENSSQIISLNAIKEFIPNHSITAISNFILNHANTSCYQRIHSSRCRYWICINIKHDFEQKLTQITTQPSYIIAYSSRDESVKMIGVNQCSKFKTTIKMFIA